TSTSPPNTRDCGITKASGSSKTSVRRTAPTSAISGSPGARRSESRDVSGSARPSSSCGSRTTAMPLTLHYVARSDVGLVRDGNEDSGDAGPSLLVLADGMGGHAAGEVASQAAVDEIMNADLPTTDDVDASIDALVVALKAANDRSRRLAVEDSTRE